MLDINNYPMQKITVELTDNNSLKALQALENENLIRIVQEPESESYALPGKPMSEQEFKSWVKFTEEQSTVSITEAKQLWAAQKKKLQRLTR
jgi:hypothetical protein